MTPAEGHQQQEWQEQQHADETNLQREILETLESAKERPLTLDELQLLAWASGVRQDFNQGVRK